MRNPDPAWASGTHGGNDTPPPQYDYPNASGAGYPPGSAYGYSISPPTVKINPATTYESPFFWFILGVGATGVVFYMIRKGHL